MGSLEYSVQIYEFWIQGGEIRSFEYRVHILIFTKLSLLILFLFHFCAIFCFGTWTKFETLNREQTQIPWFSLPKLPSLALMLRNLYFLPLLTLQTTKNMLISPQVFFSKSLWVLGVLILVMLCFGLKGVFCNRWAWSGLWRLTETYHRWAKWYF